MLIRRAPDILSRELTDERLYRDRRAFLRDAGLLAAGVALGPGLLAGTAEAARALTSKPGPFATDEDRTPLHDVTHYNNYYELGTGKGDPAENAGALRTRPWTVTIEGEVAKPGVLDLDALLKPHALEERIYRMRCVEGWSMVIPWVGFPLGDLLKRFEPTSKAKYVTFTTLLDKEQLPGQKRAVLDWPYREGLRIDEAMHPLTLLAVGLYGEELLGQNGAPLRLVVPWKYGFKGCKSIVRIGLQEQQPYTTWNAMAPGEYGFYANVNPEVDHPRWSQARERRIGELFKRKTLMFNGYADQVGALYSGLDLAKNY